MNSIYFSFFFSFFHTMKSHFVDNENDVIYGFYLHIFFFLGDKVFARKHSQPNTVYEGVIDALKAVDLIVIQFNEDFVITFDATAYFVEFSFVRSNLMRQHLAIDLAEKIFGMQFLMPKEISLRGKPLINMRLQKNMMVTCGKGGTHQWFNTNLNKKQKEAVKKILRGDMFNPYLIFGPPGMHKHLHL